MTGLMQRSNLFDHLIDAHEHRHRHVESECSPGLQVDDQVQLDRLLYWQIGGLALDKAAGVNADLAILVHSIGSIAHQTAG